VDSSILLAAIPAIAFGACALPLLLQRLGRRAAALAAAGVMAACLGCVLGLAPAVLAGQSAFFRLRWLPTYGLDFSLRVDGLGLLFALLICAIGLLVVLVGGGAAAFFLLGNKKEEPPPAAPVEVKVLKAGEVPPDTQGPRTAKGADINSTQGSQIKEGDRRNTGGGGGGSTTPSDAPKKKKDDKKTKIEQTDDPLAGIH